MSIWQTAYQYFRPSHKLRYTDITEQIMRGHYDVIMPQVYAHVPAYYIEHGIAPIYDYDPDTQYYMTKGTCTIAEMIDMHYQGLPFIFTQDTDIIDVYVILRHYIQYLQELPVDKQDPQLLLQVSKIEKLLSSLEPEYRRVLKKNKDVTSPDFNSMLDDLR